MYIYIYICTYIHNYIGQWTGITMNCLKLFNSYAGELGVQLTRCTSVSYCA